MQLTSENYYSQEANREYMSVSGYKDFAGTYGKLPCEFYAMEKLNGNWEDEKTKCMCWFDFCFSICIFILSNANTRICYSILFFIGCLCSGFFTVTNIVLYYNDCFIGKLLLEI